MYINFPINKVSVETDKKTINDAIQRLLELKVMEFINYYEPSSKSVMIDLEDGSDILTSDFWELKQNGKLINKKSISKLAGSTIVKIDTFVKYSSDILITFSNGFTLYTRPKQYKHYSTYPHIFRPARMRLSFFPNPEMTFLDQSESIVENRERERKAASSKYIKQTA